MRASDELDDDRQATGCSFTASPSKYLGNVLMRLARRVSLPPHWATRPRRGGLPVVALPPDSRVVTSDAVRRALDDEG